jgi:16S rRNA (uracil1498-N3)-methyltransferase
MEIFYTTPDNVQGNLVRLGSKESAHVARVLRHKVGDQIIVVDGRGNEYQCTITEINQGELVAEIITQSRLAREPLVQVTLGASIIKGNKLDVVVQMATELGVTQIVPLITERTIGQVTPAKLSRLRLISVAALKSSTRTMLPVIRPPMGVAEFLAEEPRVNTESETTGKHGLTRIPENPNPCSPVFIRGSEVCSSVVSAASFDLKLIAWEDEKRTRLDDVMTTAPRRVALIIGPEGGFPESEVELARQHGFRPFSMGPRRLRAETACITALAMVLYRLHEL